eukprot:CCRYP_009767-RA/>CCRYP_009767-RA protein AED:0.33 eAED:0.33 QI:0/0/0/1/0/0/3/0/304
MNPAVHKKRYREWFIFHILDAKYKKADLQSVVSTNCTHLSRQDQNKLLEFLTEYEELFDGTLGHWNTEPVSLELKEGAKPYHGRPFPPELMVALEFVRTYLDDLLCITRASLDDHLDHLRLVLSRLQEAGLQVNAPKSKLCAIETGYLGYILTRTDIKPQPNKVQVILAITPPKQVKDLRRFLCMVQYYKDLRARRSEILAPLTSLIGECDHTKITKAKKTKKKPWYWDEVHQIAFDNMKATIAEDAVLAYPDFSKEFEIYTDALSKQLGSSVRQQKYSVTEIELLAIVETLKEFKGMLWGQTI